MKENDGKAARRQSMQRIAGIFLGLVVLIVMIGFVHKLEHPTSSTTTSTKNHHGHPPPHGHPPIPRTHQEKHDPLISNQRRDKQQQQQQPQIPKPANKNTAVGHGEHDDRMQALRDGVYTLIDIDTYDTKVEPNGSYTGLRGHFCELSWASHKQDPSKTPMFRDVRGNSPDCQNPWIIPLTSDFVADLRAADDTNDEVHVLTLGGVVFHESRCGSTLVANLLQAANPAGHRVYSESPPPLSAFRMGDDFPAQSLPTLVQDVLYLMSRSRDSAETHVFFKIQSVGSRHIHVFRQAFPRVPWMFVFRDGVQILMSHFAAGPKAVLRSNCARAHKQPPAVVQHRLKLGGHQDDTKTVSGENYCAAHFATLTESALQQLQNDHNKHGRAVEYTQLPDILWTDVLPHQWNIALTDEDVARMQQVAQLYSKGRGDRAGTFEQDNERKEENAWPAVQQAAAHYLQDSYVALQALANAQRYN